MFQINLISNMIIFAICMWATLDVRVHTGFLGQLFISFVAIGALTNIPHCDFYGILQAEAATVINTTIAVLALCMAINFKDPRQEKFERRLEGERRR